MYGLTATYFNNRLLFVNTVTFQQGEKGLGLCYSLLKRLTLF